MLAPAPLAADRAGRRATQRQRIIFAMAECVAESGYAGTTVAEVARRAQVSTRAFYEHFTDKEAGFLETYDSAVRVAISRVSSAFAARADDRRGDRADVAGGPAAGGSTWREQLTAALTCWLALLASQPAFTRMYALEVWHATPAAQRRAVAGTRALVDLFRAANERACEEDPAVHRLDESQLQLLAGGVHRITVLHVLEDRIAELESAAPSVCEFAVAAVGRRP